MELGLTGLGLVGSGAYVLWLFSLARRDASIVDRFWGLGFVMIAAWYLSRGSGWPGRSYLLLGLTAAWGIRLSAYIHLRNRGKPEDPRYARWRAAGGESYWWTSLFRVFLLQALILWIVSAPLLAGQTSPTPPRWTVLDFAGTMLWLIGFIFEVVGDAQLAAFRRDPANAGHVLSTGLWRYTRHPNYFGECCVWWGFYLFAVAAGGWWSIISPLLMTFLLLRVSGVALLEKDIRERRPDYASYIKRTNAFIPGFPRDDCKSAS
jgi:steroid 5-alpha reductase family enzyme